MSVRSALIALVVLAVAAPPAIAQEDGVFVDPDSPAGREYAVPLEEARREATGTAGGTTESDGDQLFGVGIERSSSGGRGAGGAKGSGVAGGGGGNSDGGNQAGSGEPAHWPERGRDRSRGSGGSSAGLTAGIAGSVLLLGLLGGLGLRRVLRDG